MTRDQQIVAALKLRKDLKNPRPLDACRAALEDVLDKMAVVPKGLISPPRRRARQSYNRHLRQLRQLHESDHIEAIDLGTIERAIKATDEDTGSEALLDAVGGSEVLLLTFDVVGAEAWFSVRREPALSFTRATYKQKRAALEARELLLAWGAKDDFLVTTSKRKWWRMAAILFGDKNANLFQYLREIRQIFPVQS
jgi:hypothetical protein